MRTHRPRLVVVFIFVIVLLAAGAIALAVGLARRRGGLESDTDLHVLTPLDFVRPRDTGTMAEGVGQPKELHS